MARRPLHGKSSQGRVVWLRPPAGVCTTPDAKGEKKHALLRSIPLCGLHGPFSLCVGFPHTNLFPPLSHTTGQDASNHLCWVPSRRVFVLWVFGRNRSLVCAAPLSSLPSCMHVPTFHHSPPRGLSCSHASGGRDQGDQRRGCWRRVCNLSALPFLDWACQVSPSLRPAGPG